MRRRNSKDQLLVDPVKVYLEFENPRSVLGSRLVIMTEDTRLGRTLDIAYAKAAFIAKSFDTPAAVAAYKGKRRALDLPIGDEGA